MLRQLPQPPALGTVPSLMEMETERPLWRLIAPDTLDFRLTMTVIQYLPAGHDVGREREGKGRELGGEGWRGGEAGGKN